MPEATSAHAVSAATSVLLSGLWLLLRLPVPLLLLGSAFAMDAPSASHGLGGLLAQGWDLGVLGFPLTVLLALVGGWFTVVSSVLHAKRGDPTGAARSARSSRVLFLWLPMLHILITLAVFTAWLGAG